MSMILTVLGRLFPNRRWSDAEDAVFERRASRLDLDSAQVEAVIEEYRSTCKGGTPVMPDLLGRLRGAVRKPAQVGWDGEHHGGRRGKKPTFCVGKKAKKCQCNNQNYNSQ